MSDPHSSSATGQEPQRPHARSKNEKEELGLDPAAASLTDDDTLVLRRHHRPYTAERLRKVVTGQRSIHPGLVPGISVDDTDREYRTNKPVFAIALGLSLAVIIWAFINPTQVNSVGIGLQTWVVSNLGWLFTVTIVGLAVFMLVIGYGPTGRIRLGADDSEPEFSTGTWISMLFAAGLGIGLIFYGPMEPLIHFRTIPPAYQGIEAGSTDALGAAVAQAILHQASFPWVIYSFVGGAIAYSAYRRGRLPLISAIFEPVFPDAPNHPVGRIIDVFAVIVTLFGTALSLGIGALQVRTGMSLLTGQPLEGNGAVAVIISVLTVVFTFSAVSGVKTGIRILSNTNMGLVIFMALFVVAFGPTVFLLDLVPTSFMTFVKTIPDYFAVSPSQGQEEAEFVTAWTILYWAWWTSWSPFVGMFIAKISQGRSLREYVTATIFAPALISALWYIFFGGTAMWMDLKDKAIEIVGSGENVMFDLFANMPLSLVMQTVTLLAIIIFFTTAGDSTTNVLGSMSQNGRAVPSNSVTIIWGATLGLLALSLLIAGGQDALSGLQAITVSGSVPFVLIIWGIAYCWGRELKNDPVLIRRTYAREAIRKGVIRGIDEHGDDFVFGVDRVRGYQGAGADFDSEDQSLTDWYTEHSTATVVERRELAHAESELKSSEDAGVEESLRQDRGSVGEAGLAGNAETTEK
ncbi:BCCT family transporter [Corynebacterium uterequi]|uniref:Choline-glycine betaine transporter n=1 Tax=Corynebacterium uterequi TaxID=1072256 RepID=A0A0G3HI16_9CORY|nr:BCCT family transporter [Corynebacterium uterequi]AKK10772.1 choline-glycine betaine transporter [Corynebacterium uterequi]